MLAYPAKCVHGFLSGVNLFTFCNTSLCIQIDISTYFTHNLVRKDFKHIHNYTYFELSLPTV